jgi:archaellum component FlaC
MPIKLSVQIKTMSNVTEKDLFAKAQQDLTTKNNKLKLHIAKETTDTKNSLLEGITNQSNNITAFTNGVPKMIHVAFEAINEFIFKEITKRETNWAKQKEKFAQDYNRVSQELNKLYSDTNQEILLQIQEKEHAIRILKLIRDYSLPQTQNNKTYEERYAEWQNIASQIKDLLSTYNN